MAIDTIAMATAMIAVRHILRRCFLFRSLPVGVVTAETGLCLGDVGAGLGSGSGDGSKVGGCGGKCGGDGPNVGGVCDVLSVTLGTNGNNAVPLFAANRSMRIADSNPWGSAGSSNGSVDVECLRHC